MSDSSSVSNERMAFLVLSCDRYADLWPAFFLTFFEHVPHGKWPVYLGTNELDFAHNSVTTVKSGPDVDWSSSLLNILQNIPEEIVFLILEDTFLASSVTNESLLQIQDDFFHFKLNHLKYWNTVPQDSEGYREGIGEYAPGAPYRVTVNGVWRKSVLMELLIPGENPWNFEIMGSYRAMYVRNFYGFESNLFEHYNMVEKGKWISHSLNWALERNLPINVAARPGLVAKSNATSKVKQWIFAAVSKIPWTYRVSVMNVLRKLLVSY